MAKARKTIAVANIVSAANHFFLHSRDDMQAERKALQCFVDSLLMQANAYDGFQYLSQTDMLKSDQGKIPGILWGHETSDGKNQFPDKTRIYFYRK